MHIMILQYCVFQEACEASPKESIWRVTPTRCIRASLAHSGRTEGADSSQLVSAKRIRDKQKVQIAASLSQLK